MLYRPYISRLRFVGPGGEDAGRAGAPRAYITSLFSIYERARQLSRLFMISAKVQRTKATLSVH